MDKITIIQLLNKIANGEEVPRIIKYDLQTYYFRNYDYKEYDIEKDFIDEQTSFIEDKFDFYKINDEVEILKEEKKITPNDFENLGYALGSIKKYINKGYDKAIEEKKFTKEDFIKEAMDLEDITREEFNKRYEVKECNCGRGYCKGFIKVEKVQEENKIPEKLKWVDYNTEFTHGELNKEFRNICNTIDEIIDYLKNKGE